MRTTTSRIRALAGSESGLALPMVLMISVVLFLLMTMLIALVVYQGQMTSRQTSRVKAMHIADAGVNAYLYELRRNSNYWLTNPSLTASMTGGSWVVTATPPTETSPLTLRSEGTLSGTGVARTVVAAVRFPSFADYMFLSDTNINIGPGALIEGKIRSNGNVNNEGTAAGKVIAAGTVSGTGIFEAGYQAGADPIDFAQVTADLSDIRLAAIQSGTFYPASGRQGYRLTFTGSSATLARVESVSSTGDLTTTSLGTVAIPSSGVFFFNDRVWVSGTYSGRVTIAGQTDILVHDNLAPSNTTSAYSMGLIARDNVIVPSWYASMPENMTLTAAMLAQRGSVYADLQNGYVKSHIDITGSMAYRVYSYFTQRNGSTTIAGFRTRSYRYDPKLALQPPPMYPQVRDGSLKVSTWIER